MKRIRFKSTVAFSNRKLVIMNKQTHAAAREDYSECAALQDLLRAATYVLNETCAFS